MIDSRAWSTRRDREFADPKPDGKRKHMILKYNTTDGSKVTLSGINEHKDSIYVVLGRFTEHDALQPSSLSAEKY